VTDSAQCVQAVVEWFAVSARDLPWRRTRDPYGIWVSEVMLQQTQVQAVIPYWRRWMKALPNIPTLAAAPLDQVLRLWEGLGYYHRARNMHRAAAVCVRQHEGRLPEDYEALLQLPGIGQYSAGAIASLAFNQPRPIVDGNIVRLLTRLKGIRSPVSDRAVMRRLWSLAATLVEEAARLEAAPVTMRTAPPLRSYRNPQRIGWCSALNQGLMELGAVICLPRNPRCSACPLQDHCVARRKDWQARIPNRPRQSGIKAIRRLALVLEAAGAVYVRQRADGQVNAGFWEFPEIEWPAEAGPDFEERTLQRLGLANTGPGQRSHLVHSITRYRIQLEVRRLSLLRQKTFKALGGQWVPLEHLEGLPLVAAHRRITRSWGIGLRNDLRHE